jgi:hypothetical protein
MMCTCFLFLELSSQASATTMFIIVESQALFLSGVGYFQALH